MNTETFNKLLDELDGNSLETLKQKNAKYASANDCLHNFESGAEIMGSTPAQCAWGYMTKHLVALRDKVERDDFSDREDFLEKCQDIINYIRFIWLIGNDREAENAMEEVVEDLKTPQNYPEEKPWPPCDTCGTAPCDRHCMNSKENKRTYNPVEKAYTALMGIYDGPNVEYRNCSGEIEEAIGYLGEALNG